MMVMEKQEQTPERLGVLGCSALGRQVADHPDAEAHEDGHARVASNDTKAEQERDGRDVLDSGEAVLPVAEAEVAERAACHEERPVPLAGAVLLDQRGHGAVVRAQQHERQHHQQLHPEPVARRDDGEPQRRALLHQVVVRQPKEVLRQVAVHRRALCAHKAVLPVLCLLVEPSEHRHGLGHVLLLLLPWSLWCACWLAALLVLLQRDSSSGLLGKEGRGVDGVCVVHDGRGRVQHTHLRAGRDLCRVLQRGVLVAVLALLSSVRGCEVAAHARAAA